VSDPSSIATRYLPDPVSEEDLRSWVDDLAAAKVDTFVQEVYTQGWTVYWRCDGFEYDARPQHRRFLPLLEAGIQPLDVLVEQSHKNGMEFIAGIRVNDNHGHISVEQGVGAGASFVVKNPQFQLKEAPPGDFYKLSTPLDFSFIEVREFILSVMQEIVSRFDLDGLEMCFRDHRYFPPGKGPERQPLMTELVRSARRLLDTMGEAQGKKLLLGARVFASLEECRDLGLDVPQWIQHRYVDYVSPADTMYSDFNAPYHEFAALTRASHSMLYPGILPWTSFRARRRRDEEPMTQENRIALAQTIYGAGADGVSFYNHFEILHGKGGAHSPFYPMALHDVHELKDPDFVRRSRRHYVFDPTWGGHTGFGEDRASTGAVKANKMVLKRDAPNARGDYVFRVYEDLTQAEAAMLLFRAFHMTAQDQISVQINGQTVPPSVIRCRDDERRIDKMSLVDHSSFGTVTRMGLTDAHRKNLEPEPEPPFCTCWFTLTAPPFVYGENRVTAELTVSDPEAEQDIVIDELEILVVPDLSPS
jgi:hypothetical protein